MQNTHISRTLPLNDGRRVKVRPIRAEDAPALRRLVGRLSSRSRHFRYFGPKKELSEKEARRFAEVDGRNRFALVALDPEDEGEIVAVLRYDREEGAAAAEYAALVEDRFQGKGLGGRMTRLLIEAAKERGVERLFALVLHDNRPMINLLGSLDLPEKLRWEDGAERIEIQLKAA